MKNILVTGANGQLGRCLRDRASIIEDAKFFFTDVEDLDITDYSAVENFIVGNGIEAVVNCAAYTNVKNAETQQELCDKINIEGPRNLARAVDKVDGILVHVSTDYVFGGDERNTPYSEDDFTEPMNHYGLSKLLGERAIFVECSNHIIIRTAWLYSEYGNNFFKTMLKLGKEKPSVNVVIDQIGTPTYAGDLADFILIALDSSKFGTFHYTNDGIASWYDFTKAIFEIADLDCKAIPVKSEMFDDGVSRPKYSVLDKSLTKSNFNVEIPYWRDSLKKCFGKYSLH